MAPRIRSNIENRTARLRLPVRKKPYSVQIAVRPAVRLAYRRNLGNGTWSVMAEGWMKAFATADDFEEANGRDILAYHEAVEQARQIARGAGGEDSGKPLTVAEAIDRYESALKARGGDKGNATQLRHNLPKALGAKPVSLLTAHELRKWRDGLLDTVVPSSANRVANSLRAALNLAGGLDRAVIAGLASIPDAAESHNIILTDEQVRSFIRFSYDEGDELGLYVEVLAVTGTRPSQAGRLTVGDLLDDRLMIPPSRKGGKKRRTVKRPAPIPPALADRLRQATRGRGAHELLLLQPSGVAWSRGIYQRPVWRVVESAGLDKGVTIYALRHSSIVRMLLKNVPVRVVAVHHDTSVAMIEKTYSKYILDHADQLTRGALLTI